jgi:hypothetical protein
LFLGNQRQISLAKPHGHGEKQKRGTNQKPRRKSNSAARSRQTGKTEQERDKKYVQNRTTIEKTAGIRNQERAERKDKTGQASQDRMEYPSLYPSIYPSLYPYLY